jgi:hypothetical protein
MPFMNFSEKHFEPTFRNGSNGGLSYYYFSKKQYGEGIPKSGIMYLRCLEDVII